ncbi:DUF4912 domain-containing protein [Halonatronum saccharophilum]|uniref:DUF4912 domain-containing protein n=1 Tax=Halonatronum saccharophilum TaxID=150060 RepID=UPI000489FCFF|nr:DUF4912 domain-containing protein [Halonatronum saccharophilum]
MQLILLLLAVAIILVALLRPKKDKDKSRYKRNADIGFGNMKYSHESSEELTNIKEKDNEQITNTNEDISDQELALDKELNKDAILTNEDDFQEELEILKENLSPNLEDESTSKENNHRYLVSSYWRRRLKERDEEFARIPSTNFKIDLSPNHESPSERLWNSNKENELVLMTQSPDYIYAYWKANGLSFEGEKAVIRVYKESNSIDLQDNYFEIEIKKGEGEKYINLPQPNSNYYGELGLLTINEIFIPLIRSNRVTVPRAKPSENNNELWMKVEDQKREYTFYTANCSLGDNKVIYNFKEKDLDKKLSSDSFINN